MTENNYPPGTRVRRTVVMEGVVDKGSNVAFTDEGYVFDLHRAYAPGTVTIEVLAPAELGVGAVIVWENGYVATRYPSSWMVGGSGSNWTWKQMLAEDWLGPNFAVLREGRS